MIVRESGAGWVAYRAKWMEPDGSIVLGPSRPNIEEARRDLPCRPEPIGVRYARGQTAER